MPNYVICVVKGIMNKSSFLFMDLSFRFRFDCDFDTSFVYV